MATNVSYNGVTYSIPADGDTGWGPDLTAYFISLAANSLQKSGGTFALTAELGFGSSFGIKSLYYKSQAANPAASGVLRLGSAQSVSWRNNANSGDLALTTNSSDVLLFNSSSVLLAGLGSIVNADINAAAGIVYSKLNLSNSIVNADIATGAAIAYSKLNLATSIVNADISASASIAYSKLNLATSIVNADIAPGANIAMNKLVALSSNRAVITDGAGNFTGSPTTATELSYLGGATSSIQTQLNGKIGILGVVTRTSAYTATTADGLILCSGAAFTVNLYTAVGNAGREITIVKTDASLANIITIDANASETIDGALTFLLTTLNDRVMLISNGSNWVVESHTYSTALQSAGAMTIGATTTAPTKGTTTTDDLSWYRDGRNIVATYKMVQTGAGSPAAGSGDYLWSIPSGLTINTTISPAFTTVGTQLNKVTGAMNSKLETDGSLVSGTAYAFNSITAYTYSTTQFRIALFWFAAAVSEGMHGSAAFAFGATGEAFNYTVRIPISGWEP